MVDRRSASLQGLARLTRRVCLHALPGPALRQPGAAHRSVEMAAQTPHACRGDKREGRRRFMARWHCSIVDDRGRPAGADRPGGRGGRLSEQAGADHHSVRAGRHQRRRRARGRHPSDQAARQAVHRREQARRRRRGRLSRPSRQCAARRLHAGGGLDRQRRAARALQAAVRSAQGVRPDVDVRHQPEHARGPSRRCRPRRSRSSSRSPSPSPATSSMPPAASAARSISAWSYSRC